MLKILGVIGLRSGSKGLKNKNILKINKKPLAAIAIVNAIKSKYINRIIVSTDSKYYAKISNKYGAETPFLRPKRLSTDLSNELDYIYHLLNFLKKKENYKPDIIVRLLAVPLQKSEDIDKCVKKLLSNKKFDSCTVIAEAGQHPQKALKINRSNNLVGYISGSGIGIGRKQNRNQYQKAYFRSNIVASRYKTIFKFNSLTGKKNTYHIIPQNRSIDIDTSLDFKIAKFLLKKNK